MWKINAVDLDKTLIAFDSFRYFVLAHLKERSFLTPVSLYTLFRKMRLMGSADFKHKALIQLRKDVQYKEKISDLAGKVISDIKPDIMQFIQHETDTETTNVLISASPADYVKLVAKELGWPWLASDIVSGEFIHCHGLKKKELVLLHYPSEKYDYNFAISDSSSDMPLLEMFRKYELVER
jgi:phosphoserine phosphatase